MLSSRSHNVLSEPDRETLFPSSSTRHITFKTPARSLKHGRAVHDENAIYGHPKTAGLTGRKKASNAAFGTPAPGLLQPRTKTDKIPRTASKSTALSEITNKTPFNKTQPPVTPGPAFLKPFTILNDASAGASARRISSTRKKLRLPRSASKSFETPDTNGNHWDVSDVSIEVSLEEASIIEEDYDDVEYGPPTAIDPKYDPPFDMPDYKEVGATLMTLFRQSTIPEDYDPVLDFDDAALLTDDEPLDLERIELPEIPLANIFPSMVLSATQESPATIGKQTQSTTVRSGPAVARTITAAGAQLKPSVRAPPAPTLRKPGVPTNPFSNPVDRKMATMSHTRIPSLSKHISAPALPAAAPVQKPTALHSRTTSISHSRVPSVSHARTASTTIARHTRAASTVTLPSSRAASVLIPAPTSQRTLRAGSQPSQVLDDTVHSLLAIAGDEELSEEFLFEV